MDPTDATDPIDATPPDDAALDADDRAWLAGLAHARAPAEAPAGTGSTEALFTHLYADLRRQAGACLRREAAGHTLSATALAHEAWFRLAREQHGAWAGRGHFLAVAAVMMRRILVSHARARLAAKREAELVGLTLGEAREVAAGSDGAEVQAVHEALLAFEAIEPRAAQVVELKFFGGLANEEIAQALGLSPATVKRDWTLARAWLRRALAGG